MPRRPKALQGTPRKEKRSITIDHALDAWLQAQVGVGRRYASYSHAIEVAVTRLKAKGPSR